MLNKIKEFFLGKEATISRRVNGKLVELPRVSLSAKIDQIQAEVKVEPASPEIQKIYNDWSANPDAWTFYKFTSGDAGFMYRGGEIRVYCHFLGLMKEIHDLDRYTMSVDEPSSFKIIKNADKRLIKEMFYSMKARDVLQSRQKLADTIDILSKKRKKRLLIDMDGVLMDYYGAFLVEWKKRYPSRIVIAPEYIKTFYLEEMYPEEYKADILAITQGKDFFENMPPIQGAVEFMEAIWDSTEYDPFICTAPDMDSEGLMCATEKLRSIERLFGKKWLKKTIMTNDKTVIDGDILIDDKPEIKGAAIPRWKRVFYTHRYNLNQPGPRINTWANWKEVLAKV